ncbi:MAG: GAF domain-containing protein [Planctomycetota bacterium]
MAHLTLLSGPAALSRIPIDKDLVLLGRSPKADIKIRDRKASASHCRIERTPSGGFRIFDLESQNGTWLNGRRVRRRTLRAGDVIAVGTTELRFEEEAPPPLDKRRNPKTAKAFADLEGALERFLKIAGHDEREVAAQRLNDRALDVAEAVTDPEVTRLRKLVSWIRRLTNERDLSRLLSLMLDSVVELTGAERGFLYILDKGGKDGRIRVARNFDMEALRKPTFKVARGVAEEVAAGGQPVVSTNADEDPRIRSHGDTGALYLRSVACVPIRVGPRRLGSLYLDNRFERGVFAGRDLPFLVAFADQAAVALENARLHEEARAAHNKAEELNRILRGRVERQQAALQDAKALYARAAADAQTKYRYDAIVGESAVMRELFFLLDRVTDSDVPVFLCGESGSGKELAARAIHFNGPRRAGPFVSENCAAIPETRRASSSSPTGGRSSWTRSRRCRWPCRRSCSVCCRKARSGPWARNSPYAWTCASSRRAPRTWPSRCGGAPSARTSSTASTSSRSPSRRCAADRRTSRCWSSTSCSGPATASRNRSRPPPSSCSSATTGPGTCGSWRTRSCGPRRSPTARSRRGASPRRSGAAAGRAAGPEKASRRRSGTPPRRSNGR